MAPGIMVGTSSSIFMFGQPSLPANRIGPTCLSLGAVAVCSGHKVLMEVKDNILLIVGDPKGILDQ